VALLDLLRDRESDASSEKNKSKKQPNVHVKPP
jgi:hypothetical protein